MRSLVVILSCLMLALIGPAGAACATELVGRVDSQTAMQTGSASGTDCEMGQNETDQNKRQQCDHDACCGYQLAATSEVSHPLAPPTLRAADVASVIKHLTSSGGETLLDPPRA